MIKSYFSIAWRNIVRNKVYSFINVLGLALGICACLVIYLITKYEFSFDTFHPEGNRIYRITGEFTRTNGEKDFLNSVTPDMAGIERDIPGFEAKAGVWFLGSPIIIPDGSKEPKKFDNRVPDSYAPATVLTTPSYFNIFSYTWLAGSATSLNEPFKVVLTEKRAHEYFGAIPLNNIIGKTIVYEDSIPVTVSGIIKDWNKTTDFGYTDFISLGTATHSFLKRRIPTEDWSSLQPHGSMAFVKLGKGVMAKHIDALLQTYAKSHSRGDDYGKVTSLQLQPLSDLHFTKQFHRTDDGDGFRKAYLPTLYALMGLAIFILLIAAINFINLSTALSIRRAKEIGVRKVLGSRKTNIVFQFLTETFVLALFAVFISVLLTRPVLSLFNSFIPEGVKFNPFHPSTLVFLLLITIITSLLAGFYPAKILSSYLPALSLKGTALQKGSHKWNLRKGLIVFQFTISLVFIIGAIVICSQIKYMNKADKGFNTDAIITLNNWRADVKDLKVFAQNIKQLPGVSKVLLQGTSPMGFAQNLDIYKYKGKEEMTIQANAKMGNDDFIPFYKMKLLAGRNMLHSDSLNELVINETLSKKMGFATPADAIGKLLYSTNNNGIEKAYPIVGVVADFHTGSYHEAISPVLIENVPNRMHSVAIKLAGNEKHAKSVKATLSQMELQWKKIFPETPFDYSFLNESITWLFAQEENTAWLINAATIITIFISCMGLFGLIMFTAELKTKEIGIRKVLGATVLNITTLLSKDFIILVSIALLIASPIAWYFSNQWLQDFAYRIKIHWSVFALAGVSAISIALVTISWQAIKAAIANPVKALRSE